MNTKRREFLKHAGMAGAGILSGTFLGSSVKAAHPFSQPRSRHGRFNMCGYAAPALEKVRIGFIGIGMRGPTHVNGFSHIDGVEIKGLCDIRPERVAAGLEILKNTKHQPQTYTGSADAWKKMCDREDIDLVVIATPWEQHTPQAVYAMEAGKHVAIEVPATTTVEGCWQLVHTSEQTRRHCMMMENCCYDFFELQTLHMARDGYFGEVLHTEGAYLHYLLDLNFNKNGYWNMWRLKENYRNGNLYPTHGLGPICQILDENRGDRMAYMSSTSGKDFSMGERAKELAVADSFYKPFAGKKYRGNMNITNIHTANGKTITLYHDVSTKRPYSRIHLVTGLKGHCRKYPKTIISKGEHTLNEAEMRAQRTKYTPELVSRVGELAKKIGGHGGMDFIMQWRLIDCLRNGLPIDQDVYDAASWSVVSPLSEWSVAHESSNIDFPDFTNGHWETNKPVELTLKGGGNTKVIGS